MHHDDDDQPVRLTTDEIGLMREIVKWRKSRVRHGLQETEFVKRNVYGAPHWIEYITRCEVWFDRKNEHPMAIRRDGETWSDVVPTQSFTEAVDLLVAYGYLPARFSTAYRSGWEAVGQSMARPLSDDLTRDISDLEPAVKR